MYVCNFSSVYNKLGFIEVVRQAVEDSMTSAVEEVKGLPDYVANNGEVSVIS